MGIMTATAMTAEVTRRINRTDLNSSIATWLYRAALDLSTYRKFFGNEKTDTMVQAVDTAIANWPSDMLVPIRLEWSDGSVYYNCAVKDLVYVRELYHAGSTGRPDYVARHGGVAYFDRVADQAYTWTVYYKFRIVAFTTTQTSPLGGEWDEALIRHATYNAFATLRQWQLADYHLKSYYSYVQGRLGDVEETEGAWNESFAGDIDNDPYTF